MSDDRALRDRLANLAAAVPVPPPSTASTLLRKPVTLGPALRTPVSRSWLPVALVAVLVVAAVGILASGSQPAYGPVVETVRQGDFELTLRAEKGRYAAGEPIEIEATLTYSGAEAGVQIGHASGAGQSPIGFGIKEPVLGDLRLGPGWDEMCVLTQLTPNTPLEQGFQKSSGWSDSNPRAAEYQAWVEDPELRLDQGTWHVFAVAEFSMDECGPAEYQLQAEIAITVQSASATPTEPPAPRELANPPQSTTVRDGDFELTIRSDKSRYAPNEAIDLTTSLTYVGTEDLIEIHHNVGSGPLVVAIREPVYGVELQPATRLACTGSTLESGVPYSESGLAGGFAVPDGPNAEILRGLIRDPILRLPAGTWHLYAWAQTMCLGAGPTTNLQAEITIVVADDPAVTPSATPLPRPSETATPSTKATGTPVQSTSRDAGWELVLEAPRDHYQAGEAIDARITLTNVGVSPDPFLLSQSPLFDLSVVEVGGDRHAEILSDGGCAPFGYWERGQPQEYPFELRWQNGLTAEPSSFWNDVEGPRLTLPSGTWTLRASARFFGEPCDSASEIALDTEITVVVEPSGL